MTAEKVQKHIFIAGRVQGVGFRAFISRQAADLNLTGWAKNLSNGQVEVVIQGKNDNIKKMIKKLKKGPTSAQVDNIKVTEEEKEKFASFNIRF